MISYLTGDFVTIILTWNLLSIGTFCIKPSHMHVIQSQI